MGAVMSVFLGLLLGSLVIKPDAPEVSTASSPEESSARTEKNLRYNGGACDITTAVGDNYCLFEQYEPRDLSPTPVGESAAVLIGRATSRESFLSADRTHIYTETTVWVEAVLGRKNEFNLPSDRILVIDQVGGEIRSSPARVLRDGTRTGFMGALRPGGRYVVFVRQVHDGKDLTILKAYELREGKVFRLREDGRVGGARLSRTPNRPDWMSSERAFLRALRKEAARLRQRQVVPKLD